MPGCVGCCLYDVCGGVGLEWVLECVCGCGVCGCGFSLLVGLLVCGYVYEDGGGFDELELVCCAVLCVWWCVVVCALYGPGVVAVVELVEGEGVCCSFCYWCGVGLVYFSVEDEAAVGDS